MFSGKKMNYPLFINFSENLRAKKRNDDSPTGMDPPTQQ